MHGRGGGECAFISSQSNRATFVMFDNFRSVGPKRRARNSEEDLALCDKGYTLFSLFPRLTLPIKLTPFKVGLNTWPEGTSVSRSEGDGCCGGGGGAYDDAWPVTYSKGRREGGRSDRFTIQTAS